MLAISFVWTKNLAWFDLHEIFLHLLFTLCPASLCYFPSTHLLDPADTTQTFLLSPPSPSTSEDLAVAVNQRRRVQNTLCSLSVSSVFRDQGGGGERGNCFHCSVEKHRLDRKGILAAVTEKLFSTFLFELTICVMRLWILFKTSEVRNCHFIFTSSFSLTLSSC